MPLNTLNYRSENIDRLLARLYFPALVCLCLFSIIHYFRVAHGLAAIWSGWSIGDWVINYADGPTRRGLSGEVIFFIARVFDLKVNWLIFAIQGVSLILTVGLFLKILRSKNLTFWYVVACFSPGFFLLFTYYDSMAIGRKEILLYLTFMAWVYLCNGNRLTTLKTIIFCVIYFCLTLTHESFFFYSPYFCAAVWLCKCGTNKLSVILIPVSSTIAAVLTFVFFKTIDPSASCHQLLALDALPEVCAGVLSAGPQDAILLTKNYFDSFDLGSLFNLSGVFLLVLTPVYLIIQTITVKKEQKYLWLTTIFCLIVFSLPLFIFAIDWGRWISMHTTLSIMMLLLALDNRAGRQNMPPNARPFAQFTTLTFAIILFSVFTLSYSLGHCCAQNFIKPLGPLDKIRHMSIFQAKSAK
jgi:hypothetical protein